MSIYPQSRTRSYSYGSQYSFFVSTYDWGSKDGKGYGAYPWWILARDNLIGWFDSPQGGNQIKETDVCRLTANTTFYAHWKPFISKITFKLDGGTYHGLSSDPVIDYILTDGIGNTAFGRVPKPTRDDVAFLGWRTIPDDRIIFDELVPHSVWPYQRSEWIRSDKYFTYELCGDYQLDRLSRVRTVNSSFVPPFGHNRSEDPDYIPYYYTEYDDDPSHMKWYNGFTCQGDIAVFADWQRYEVVLDHQGG